MRYFCAGADRAGRSAPVHVVSSRRALKLPHSAATQHFDTVFRRHPPRPVGAPRRLCVYSIRAAALAAATY